MMDAVEVISESTLNPISKSVSTDSVQMEMKLEDFQIQAILGKGYK